MGTILDYKKILKYNKTTQIILVLAGVGKYFSFLDHSNTLTV